MFEIIAHGATAEIINWGSDRVLKRFAPQFGQQRVEEEAARQRTAWDAGLPVPQITEVIESEGLWGIVMEKVPTTTIADITDSTSQMLDYLVMLQRKIHEVDIMFPTLRSRLETQLFNAKLPLDTLSLQLRRLQEMPSKITACHFDLHPNNIMGDGKQWWILDWADAATGDAKADVCRTWMILSISKPDLAEMYQKRWADVGMDHFEEWIPILAAARLSENRPPMENVLLREWAKR